MKKIIPITFLCFIVDQITKFMIINTMHIHESFPVIKNFFHITYVQNDGAAWSMLKGNRFLLIVIALIALGLMCFFIFKNQNLSLLENVSISILIGGILGNLIDRILYGYVIDFLDFRFGSYYFPVFNVADICIVISVILIIITLFRRDFGGRNTSQSR